MGDFSVIFGEEEQRKEIGRYVIGKKNKEAIYLHNFVKLMHYL